MNKKYPHIPVMLNEVLEYLKPNDNEIFLDGTFGAGGYSRAILESSNCELVSTDRDEHVKFFADELKEEYQNRFNFLNIKFSEIKDHIKNNYLDGIVLDLGVSSMQLDNLDRGFSFNKESDLTMTMGKNNITAYDIVNYFKEKEIAEILYKYGEEHNSYAIAEKICKARKNKKIKTTVELANLIRECFAAPRFKIDMATKTFQAIRIFVNDELNELETLLRDSIDLLKKGGRLIIVTFHSLEDRIVKNFFNKFGDAKHIKVNKYKNDQIEEKNIFRILTKKPLIVSKMESRKNIRSRSAKLRGAIKC